MTPATNMVTINSQQHPTQYAPWRAPIDSAPNGPSRQRAMKKPIGVRQWRAHAAFIGVN